MFGLYCVFYSNTPGWDWLPPFFLATITFSGCMGVLPIPYIVTIEILPPKVCNVVWLFSTAGSIICTVYFQIRSTCLAFIISIAWLLLFAVGSIFPFVQAEYGLHTCLFIFGSSSSLLAAYTYYFMPETLGKSSEEIMEILRT